MSRSRHPDKHIELAIQFAESLGWRVELSRGHAGATFYVPGARGKAALFPCGQLRRIQRITPATSGGK